MLGGTLGPYRIEAELGSGGMGCVYLARVEGRAPGLDDVPALEVGTRVAIKVIHPHLIDTPSCLRRFLFEGRLGQRVRDPNVVSTYDCDVKSVDGEDRRFLVMEYVQGQTLRSMLDELGTLPEDLCLHIGRQITSGLQAIHQAGAVHRDLKPENVLVTPQHEVKIMDLGVARLLGDPLRLSQMGFFIGSILYAPPEAFRRGGSDVDERADLHSLGVLLYEIATGVHPFRHDDAAVALRLVLSKRPAPASDLNPQLSPFFEDVVRTLCAKRAEKRFPSAKALLRVLEEGEQGEWWLTRARALANRSQRPRRRLPRSHETALYGRERELEILQAAHEQSRDGNGQVILVDGEAGVGKTRLIDELVARLQQTGEEFHFLFGSYPPGGAATVAGAFSTAFREHFGAIGLEETLSGYLKETPLMVPAFASLLVGDPPSPVHESLTKGSLQTLFIHATHALARERTTIILVDDLHFAPSEGRALFAALALAVPRHRVLLIGTMRPGVPTNWGADVERLVHARRLSLSRLGPADLNHLLVDAFRSERLVAQLGPEISQKSDGNPFFVFEILRGLRERGQIRREPDGGWSSAEACPVIRMPSSIVDLLQARLAGLQEQDVSLLEIAACCGFRFDPLLIAGVLDLSDLEVLRRLGRIERLHFLVRSTGRTCTFDHHQIQELLYAGISELLKERYHGAIADVLAARADSGGRELGGAQSLDLCRHALQGGRADIALTHLDPALDHLEASYLNEAAVDLADAALEARGLLRNGERCRILLRKAHRLHLTGRREEQAVVLDEAEPLAVGTVFESRVQEARGDLCHTLSHSEESARYFGRALAAARERGDPHAEASALTRLGASASKRGHIREAGRYFSDSLALAQAIGDLQAEGVATGNLGLVALDRGQYDRATHLMNRQLEIAQETGNLASQSVAMGNLGVVCAEQGRPEEARAHLARKLEIARQLGDRMGEAIATANLGMTLHSLGRFEEARTSYECCVDIAREIGAREGEANAAGNLGMILYSLGRYESAVESYRRAVAIWREIGNTMGEADALSSLGTLEVALGSWDAAGETLKRSLTLAREIGAMRTEAYALHGLALLAEERSEYERAQDFYGQALARWNRMGAKEALADTYVAMGRLALARSRPEQAAAHLDAALELCRDTQVPGTTLLATVLRARLPDGDPQTALEALHEYESRVGSAERMASQFGLYQITARRVHLDEARRVLGKLLENAPADRRASMRQHVRLHQRILADGERGHLVPAPTESPAQPNA